MRPPFEIARRLVILALCLAVAACGGPAEKGPAAPSLLTTDPEIVALDHGAPALRLGRGGGSMLLGSGWSLLESFQDDSGERVFFVWGIDGESVLYAPAPPTDEIDFYAECLPTAHPRGRAQELTLSVGGREIASIALEEGWQTVRLPLPAGSLSPGLNELRLGYRHAIRPDRLGESADRRRLTAAFRRAALVPRRVADAAAFLDANRLEEGHLTLAGGSAAAVPLPVGRTATLRLGEVSGDCSGCLLRLELLTPGAEARTLFEGPARGVAEREVAFETPAVEIGLLRLRLEALTEPPETVAVARFELPRDFLMFGPAKRAANPAGPPHVFVYLVDTLRADALSPYGGPADASPAIEAFARDAVTYLDAWSPSSWTLPAVVSLLTGVYPDRHGVLRGETIFSGENAAPLAGRLGEAGYASVAVSQSLVASPAFGLDAGFETFLTADELNGRELRSHRLRGYLLQLLAHRHEPGRPLFAYLHGVSPHAPYTPTGAHRRFAEAAPGALAPEEYEPALFLDRGRASERSEVAHLRGLYQGEAAYADGEFGRFLALLGYLGLYERSLIVFLSDHGEEFAEHGGFEHGRTVYEELLRVPLLVKYPGGEWAGTRVARRVSTLDVVPTILEVSGLEPGSLDPDGRSLSPPALETRRGVRERLVFAMTQPAPTERLASVDDRALAIDGLKCVESRAEIDQFGEPVARLRAFDLETDPGERAPLAAEDPRLERCRNLLDGWAAARSVAASSEETIDEALREKLRALGYLE